MSCGSRSALVSDVVAGEAKKDVSETLLRGAPHRQKSHRRNSPNILEIRSSGIVESSNTMLFIFPFEVGDTRELIVPSRLVSRFVSC